MLTSDLQKSQDPNYFLLFDAAFGVFVLKGFAFMWLFSLNCKYRDLPSLCFQLFLFLSEAEITARLMTSCLTLPSLLGSPANKCGVRGAQESSLSHYAGQSLTKTLVFLPLKICLIIGIATPTVLDTWRGSLAAPWDVPGDAGDGEGGFRESSAVIRFYWRRDCH